MRIQQSTARRLPARQEPARRGMKRTPLTLIQRHRALDGAMRDGIRQMIRTLPARPAPRQQFDNALAKRAISYNGLLTMIAAAIDAGVPKEDALAPALALVRVIELAYPDATDQSPVLALVTEADVDADADKAQVRALAERTPSAYLIAAEASERHARIALETSRVLYRAVDEAVVGRIGGGGGRAA